MIVKVRSESLELQILRILRCRMNLSEEEERYYFKLEKGYEGEVQFDQLTEQLTCDCLILNDLLLKHNQSTFQIDTLLIMSDAMYLFEVKNYEGDYFYEAEKIYKKPKLEILNPLSQLSRTESLLRQLFHNLGYTPVIKATVIFINSEFTLYEAPLNKPFVFPTQIHRHLKRLNTVSSTVTKKHRILADKLVSLHLEKSPYMQLPTYQLDQLERGITCKTCRSLSVSVEERKCVCQKCGQIELMSLAIMRSVKEFKLLFPEEKLTSSIIHTWCGEVVAKRTIRRILEKQLKKISKNRWTYFE